jgi:hypothetical protein
MNKGAIPFGKLPFLHNPIKCCKTCDIGTNNNIHLISKPNKYHLIEFRQRLILFERKAKGRYLRITTQIITGNGRR